MIDLDIDEKIIDREYVEKKVEDWKKRVYNLYDTVQQWMVGSEYTFEPRPEMEMKEYYMYLHKVPPIMLKSYRMYKKGDYVLSIYPKGLWIIGTNGMVDILSKKDRYHLADYSEDFKEPQWQMFRGMETTGTPFDKCAFLETFNL